MGAPDHPNQVHFICVNSCILQYSHIICVNRAEGKNDATRVTMLKSQRCLCQIIFHQHTCKTVEYISYNSSSYITPVYSQCHADLKCTEQNNMIQGTTPGRAQIFVCGKSWLCCGLAIIFNLQIESFLYLLLPWKYNF